MTKEQSIMKIWKQNGSCMHIECFECVFNPCYSTACWINAKTCGEYSITQTKRIMLKELKMIILEELSKQ